MFGVFTLAIKFDCLFSGIFQSFQWFVTLIFDKSTPLTWIYVSKDALNHFLVQSSAKKAVSEELKYVVLFFFCTLFNRPMGGATAPPPLATLLPQSLGNFRNFLKK